MYITLVIDFFSSLVEKSRSTIFLSLESTSGLKLPQGPQVCQNPAYTADTNHGDVIYFVG